MAESHVQHTDERFEHVQAALSSDTLLSHASSLLAVLAFAIRCDERSFIDAVADVSFQLEQQRASTTTAANSVEARINERDYDKVASGTLQIYIIGIQTVSADLGLQPDSSGITKKVRFHHSTRVSILLSSFHENVAI